MSKLRPPSAGDKVFNDECIYSFDNPFTDSGIYVCLTTYQGVGAEFLMEHAKKTNSQLYLHTKWTKTVREEVVTEESATQPTKLAIGVEGGFSTQTNFELIKEHSLVVVDSATASIPVVLSLQGLYHKIFFVFFCI